MEIAARNPRTAEMKLAGLADGNGVELFIEDVCLHVRDRTADGDGRPRGEVSTLRRVEERGGDGGFGGAVGVEPFHLVTGKAAPRGVGLRENLFVADDDEAERWRQRGAENFGGGNKFLPEGGGQIEDGDAFLLNELEEVREGRERFLVAQDDGRTGEEGRKYFLGGDIETERGELQHPVARSQGVATGESDAVIDERGVFNEDALGPAGGAARVNDVGERGR